MESDGRGVSSDAGERVSGERKPQRKKPGMMKLTRIRMIRPLIGRRKKKGTEVIRDIGDGASRFRESDLREDSDQVDERLKTRS
jgi:hypothetical protein